MPKKKNLPSPEAPDHAPVHGVNLDPPEYEGRDILNLAEFTWHGWPSVLKHVRECMGMDQSEFGQMLGGWNRSQIARYETADAEPQIAFWTSFAKTTSLSLTWVFTGLGKPYEYRLQALQDFITMQRWLVAVNEKDDVRQGWGGPPVYLRGPNTNAAGELLDAARSTVRAPAGKKSKRKSGSGGGSR